MFRCPRAQDRPVTQLDIVMLESLPALHDVGHIQPAGVVLVFDGKSETIVAASNNLETRIANWSAAEAIGLQADEVLGHAIIHDARNAEILPSFQRLPELLGVTNLGAGDIEISVHGTGQHVVVEICEAQPEPSALKLIKDLTRLEDRMRHGQTMSDVLCDAVGLFRIMSGYDLVQAIRLRPDGQAVLVAESRRAALELAPGTHVPWPLEADTLRFPPFRNLVDAESPPVHVIARAETDIDLGLCQTIMPSARHIADLSRMGIRSELTVPLATDDTVWGAFVFQGQRPRTPSPRFTYLCMSLAPLLKEMLSGRDP